MLTVPWFWGEVKGYSKLYSDPQAYGGIPYMLFSIAAFLVFTDFGIYWIHRFLHHPILYKRLHKVHIVSLFEDGFPTPTGIFHCMSLC